MTEDMEDNFQQLSDAINIIEERAMDEVELIHAHLEHIYQEIAKINRLIEKQDNLGPSHHDQTWIFQPAHSFDLLSF